MYLLSFLEEKKDDAANRHFRQYLCFSKMDEILIITLHFSHYYAH